MQLSTRKKMAAVVLPFALFIAACGSSDSGSDGSKDSGDTAKTTMADNGSDSSTTMADDTGSTDMAAPEGDGCAAVPKSGDGSFEGMAQDPVATAASNNPALSTLVTAVGEADLVDTLNTGGPFTIFAPVNDAFAKLPKADLDAVLADKDQLTSILTYHVVPERIEPADLGGTYKTVNGAELTVSGDAPSFDVGDGQATVICSGVQTANATVYLIDSVLMPPAS
jgi:uncharacterized surface protein with fasciclin (FAS1) repeats